MCQSVSQGPLKVEAKRDHIWCPEKGNRWTVNDDRWHRHPHAQHTVLPFCVLLHNVIIETNTQHWSMRTWALCMKSTPYDDSGWCQSYDSGSNIPIEVPFSPPIPFLHPPPAHLHQRHIIWHQWMLSDNDDDDNKNIPINLLLQWTKSGSTLK